MQQKYNILEVMFHIVRGNDVIPEYDVVHTLSVRKDHLQ